MLDDVVLRTQDLVRSAAMPNRFPPHTPALSADGLHEDARAKAIHASYEFWRTGDEALLEQAFAETSAEHAVPLGEPGTNGLRLRPRLAAPEKESK